MIPNDLIEGRTMIRYMISALESNRSLTEWESEFIQSVSSQFDEKENLLNRQCERPEQIYDKYN